MLSDLLKRKKYSAVFLYSLFVILAIKAVCVHLLFKYIVHYNATFLSKTSVKCLPDGLWCRWYFLWLDW